MSEEIVVVEKIPKIEGHMNFSVVIRGGKVVKARAEALEGIRLLERLLVGMSFREVPDVASRMCGVCQAIHKVTAVQAVEDALGIELPEELEMLRKLVVIGGHLQSHILHLYFFVLPNFLGRRSILDLLPDNEELVKTVLKLKKLANALTEITGGRAVHPVTPVVGGFSKIPSRHSLERALALMKKFKELLGEPLDVILSLDMPDFKRKTTYVSLYTGRDFPLLRGKVKISGWKVFEPHEYENYIEYVTENYSSARHYVLRNGSEYMVGALARLNVNYELLSDSAKELAETYGLKFPSNRPFDNNKAQALELLHFSEEAITILEELLGRAIKTKKVPFKLSEGEGVSVTEAPRGLLIHHYKLDSRGRVEKANIITPTAQNYKCMEADALDYVTSLLGREDADVKHELEKLIRAYDPCVSCSARFFREH